MFAEFLSAQHPIQRAIEVKLKDRHEKNAFYIFFEKGENWIENMKFGKV